MRQVKRAGIGSEYGFGRRGGYPLLSHDGVNGTFAGATLVNSGRAAIALAIRHILLEQPGRRRRFLLPAYLCHTMLQPFLEANVDVGFYPVGADLRIDTNAVAGRVDQHTAGILAQEYFGFSQPCRLADTLPALFPGVHVIEDRTHALVSDLTGATAASPSATAVYSVRKWGPFPDLGIVRWPRNILPRCFPGGCGIAYAGTRLLGLLLRSGFLAFPCEPLRKASLRVLKHAEEMLDERISIGRTSPVSAFVWKHWDVAPVWEARRRNFAYLLRHWPDGDVQPLFRQLPANVCPLGFPVRSASRDAIRRRLIEARIYAPVHWRRPDQVDPIEFSGAARLACEELTLPIDQRYSSADMDSILEVIR